MRIFDKFKGENLKEMGIDPDSMKTDEQREAEQKKEEGIKEWENKIKEKRSNAIKTAMENFAYTTKSILEGKSNEEIKKGIYFKVNNRKFMINAQGKFPKDIFDAMLWELDEEGDSMIHTEVRIDYSEDAKRKNKEKFSIEARQAKNPDFYKSNFREYYDSESKLTEFTETEKATHGLACGLETMDTVAKGKIEFE